MNGNTITVSIEVLDYTLLLDGVSIILQGVRVMPRADGLSVAEMPCYRHTD